jgi:hypothetical protein
MVPTYMNIPNHDMHAEHMDKRRDRSALSESLLPFVRMLLHWLQARNWFYSIIGSHAMLQVLSDDPAALEDASDKLAFAPNDWNIWVIVSDEATAIDASTQLCKYFRDVLLGHMRQNKALRKKRIYAIANRAECVVDPILADIPYPARWTGIALGERSQKYIDVRVLNLGRAFNADRFRSAYVTPGAPFLNLAGCITFLELIKSKRKEKKYNIDGIRQRVFGAHLLRQMGTPQKVASWYQDLAKTFTTVFNGTDFLTRNNGTIGRLLLRSLEHSSANEMEECESRLIEALRPTVNATIEAIEEKLNEEDIGHIFVTGGDAMRRFDSAIKVSKDIDTKIYVKSGRHVHDALEVATILCAKAVTMMIQMRGKILPPNVEKVVCGTPVGLLYTDKSADNLQFRLRYLPAEANGRPRLISIDYRMRIRVGNMEFNHSIPVLDVVIQRSPSKEAPLSEGARPPFAALDWLVHDIRETWGSSSRAKQRVWAGKREKNEARLASLEKLLAARKQPDGSPLGVMNTRFLEYMRDQNRAPAIPDYLELFGWAEDRKRYLGPLDKKSSKQKVPFSQSKMNEWRREMRSVT